jgi:phage terminase large subunit-like protein
MVKPRFARTVKGNSSLGNEAVDLAASAGLVLDDWQAYVLRESLRQKGKKHAAFEVGVNVARQNGKGAILEARELAELFLVRSDLTIHSAHNFSTSLMHFNRFRSLIEETPHLRKELAGGRTRGIFQGSGAEHIELVNPKREIHFRTRTKGGGRGFSCDLLVLDEAMFIPEYAYAALFPMQRARPNPQVWYTGSAVDQLVHENAVIWTRIRERGIAPKPDDERLVYFEWSIEGENPSSVPDEVRNDRSLWKKANPALGIRIDPDHMKQELLSMPSREAAVELLGIGDWPRTDYADEHAIDYEAWIELEDADSVLQDPICLAFDVSPDRQASIAAAGLNQNERWHVEITDSRRGTAWVVERILALSERHKPAAVVCDGYGPASSLVPALEAAGVPVIAFTASEHGAACGRLVDAVSEGTIRHVGDPRLVASIRAAATRPLGDAWAWSRKSSSDNISPLVSVTLALSAAMVQAKRTAFVLA